MATPEEMKVSLEKQFLELLNQENSALEQSKKTLTNTLGVMGKLGVNQKTMEKGQKELSKLYREELQSRFKELDIQGKKYKLGEKVIKREKDKLRIFADNLAKTKVQEKVLTRITEQHKASLGAMKAETEVLRSQGKYMQAFLKDKLAAAKAKFTNEDGSKSFGKGATAGAGAAVAAKGLADNPRAALDAMGPWGMLAGIILDIIDGIRLTTGELKKADAATGNFAGSMDTARTESIALNNSMTSFATMGLNLKEVTKVYTELKDTGIKALGVVPLVGVALSETAENAIAFGLATKLGTGTVIKQFETLVRSFGISEKEASQKYADVFSVMSEAAEAGIEGIDDLMSTVTSLGDAFKDVGFNAMAIPNLVKQVGSTLAALGRPGGIDQINKVTEGIMGIAKASDGAKVFMAKLSGAQGGYYSSLFEAEQRKGGELPGAEGFDADKMIQMATATFQKVGGSISDPNQRRGMMENIAKNKMGMSKEVFQVMNQIMEGQIGVAAGKDQLDKIHEQAKETNMTSKGMFDILKDILIGMIAKPIVGIYSWLMSSPWSKATPAEKLKAQEMADAVAGKGNRGAGGASGVDAATRSMSGSINKAGIAVQGAGGKAGAGGSLNVTNNFDLSGPLKTRAQFDAKWKDASEQTWLAYLAKYKQAQDGSR